jgi:hypothetical protein
MQVSSSSPKFLFLPLYIASCPPSPKKPPVFSVLILVFFVQTKQAIICTIFVKCLYKKRNEIRLVSMSLCLCVLSLRFHDRFQIFIFEIHTAMILTKFNLNCSIIIRCGFKAMGISGFFQKMRIKNG